MTKKITQQKDQKKIFSDEENIREQLIAWANEGSKKSIQKIKDFISQNDDDKLKFWAEIALEEAEYFCYAPDNKKEEYDFQLAQMVFTREEKLYYKMSKANAARLELRKLDVERIVHEGVLKSLTDKDQIKNWKYNFCEDYYLIVKNRLQEIEEGLAYEEAWLEQAKKMVEKTQYKDVSRDFFQSIHEDGEDIDFWSDNNYWEDEEEELLETNSDN